MFAAPTKKKSAPASQPASKARSVDVDSNEPVQPVFFQLATHPLAALASGQTSSSASGVSPPRGNSFTPRFGLIIEDGSLLGPGQMYRSEFMQSISAEIERVADQELRPAGQTARDCPYLNHWLQFYRNRPAAHIERMIQHYARPERSDLEGLRDAILRRVRTAVRAWIRSGGREIQAPEGVNWLDSDDRINAPDNPAVVRSQLGNGQPLASPLRSQMERGFGQNFSDVRVHTDSDASRLASSFSARAFTVGNDVGFGPGEYRPGTLFGDALIAHELAHTLQQRDQRSAINFESGNQIASAALEHDADRGAIRAISTVWGNSEVHESTRSLAQPRLSVGLRLSRCGGCGGTEAPAHRIPDPNRMGYDIVLSRAGNPAEPAVRDLASLEQPNGTLDTAAFARLPSDRALNVLALHRHVAGTRVAGWFPTLLGLAVTLSDPYGGASSVTAYYIPGRTDRRALIIGGVHNLTEPQGARVVERLRTLLQSRLAATPSQRPFFTTILVPSLFDTSRYNQAQGDGRWIQGGMGLDTRGTLQTNRFVEPNRNFPLPGEDLAAARARGASSPTAAELVFQPPPPATPGAALPPVRPAHDLTPGPPYGGTSTRMLPETRTLIALIEHFRPERIASVHAHSIKATPGDAPGIFVDPRGIDANTGAVTNAAQAAEDDRLATAMVREGQRRLGATPIAGAPSDPFAGNAPGTSRARARYASGRHSEGTSLGMWAPTPVTSGPGARAGITTMTIEVPQWRATRRNPQAAAQLSQIEDLDRDLLADIFLEDPSVVTPGSGPVTP